MPDTVLSMDLGLCTASACKAAMQVFEQRSMHDCKQGLYFDNTDGIKRRKGGPYLLYTVTSQNSGSPATLQCHYCFEHS